MGEGKKVNIGLVVLVCALFVVIIAMGVWMILYKTGAVNSGNENEVSNGGSTNVVDNDKPSKAEDTNVVDNDKPSKAENTNVVDNDKPSKAEDTNVVDNSKVDGGMKIENASFFNEYLKVFLPQWSAGNFQRSITEFTDEDITSYIFWYVKNSGKNGATASGEVSCKVTKSELNSIVDKYFDKATYKIVLAEQGARTGIRKLSDDIYEVFWFGTSSLRPVAYNESVKYDGNKVEVIYNLKYEYAGGALGDEKLTFNLEYSDGRYIVKKITYDKEYRVGDEITLKDGSKWTVIKKSIATDDYVTVLG